MRMLWFVLFGLFAASSGRAQGFELMHQLRTDLSHARSYSWKPAAPPTAEKLTAERFHEQIDKDMQAKGWKLLPAGGDIVLSSGSVVTLIDEDDFNGNRRPNALAGSDVRTPDYAGEQPAATTARILTVVAYDAGGKKPLWEARVKIRLMKELKDTMISVERSADLLISGFVPAGK